MSTRCAHYVVQGVMFDAPKRLAFNTEENYLKYDDIREGPYGDHKPNDFVMINEPFNGEYLFVGWILAKGSEEGGLPMTRLGGDSAWLDDNVDEKLTKDFPEIWEAYIAEKAEDRARIGRWAFTNWA